MAENKTKRTDASVTEFLDGVTDARKRADSYEILHMMQKATKAEPYMWGSSIVGFGDFHYVTDSGREGDVGLIGFSPRKQALTLYSMSGWEQNPVLLESLGKYSLGKSCLYIKRLDDVDKPALRKLIADATKRAKKLAARDAKKAKKKK